VAIVGDVRTGLAKAGRELLPRAIARARITAKQRQRKANVKTSMSDLKKWDIPEYALFIFLR
jgi:hypothetical protein